jgi:hypothetical protein
MNCDRMRSGLIVEVAPRRVLLDPEPSGYSTAADRLRQFPDAVMAGKLGMPVWSFDRRFAVMRVKPWR